MHNHTSHLDLVDKTPNLTHLQIRSNYGVTILEMVSLVRFLLYKKRLIGENSQRHIQHLSSLSKLQVFEIQMMDHVYKYRGPSNENLQQMLTTVKGLMNCSPPAKGVIKHVRVLPSERPQCIHPYR